MTWWKNILQNLIAISKCPDKGMTDWLNLNVSYERISWLGNDLHTTVWSGSDPFQTLMTMTLHKQTTYPDLHILKENQAAYVGWVETHHRIGGVYLRKRCFLIWQVFTRNSDNIGTEHVMDFRQNYLKQTTKFIFTTFLKNIYLYIFTHNEQDIYTTFIKLGAS